MANIKREASETFEAFKKRRAEAQRGNKMALKGVGRCFYDSQKQGELRFEPTQRSYTFAERKRMLDLAEELKQTNPEITLEDAVAEIIQKMELH